MSPHRGKNGIAPSAPHRASQNNNYGGVIRHSFEYPAIHGGINTEYMDYIALLRGINVGNSVKINMKELKTLFEQCGFSNVSTYINSGNVIFKSNDKKNSITENIEKVLHIMTGNEVKVLVKTKSEMVKIASSIPDNWQNNDEQKTDVASLFESIDTENIINELSIKKEYIQLIYVEGALIWNVRREDYNKSHLNKIISHKTYKDMTIRNVNTARYLAKC